jgi:hypothetical protein
VKRLAECHYCQQAVKVRKNGHMVEHKTPAGAFCPGSAMRPRRSP